jgi:hypothetical protein
MDGYSLPILNDDVEGKMGYAILLYSFVASRLEDSKKGMTKH